MLSNGERRRGSPLITQLVKARLSDIGKIKRGVLVARVVLNLAGRGFLHYRFRAVGIHF